jgi:hypothetical protein
MRGGGHVAHWPFEHFAVAHLAVQSFPHVPQLYGSEVRSTHIPAAWQAVCPAGQGMGV